MSIRYKGHLVDPRTYKLRGREGFTAEVYVFDARQGTDTQFLLSPSIFPTKEIAEQTAIQVGCRAIDRGYDPSFNPYAQ